jgi:hypothetical protein
MCVLLEAGLVVPPHALVKQLVSVLEEGLECVGKGYVYLLDIRSGESKSVRMFRSRD